MSDLVQLAISRSTRPAWLKKKTNRQRRLREHREYIELHSPELADLPRGLVVDLGCGPGELLEIAQEMGHDALGVDATSGAGGMGDDYLQVSRAFVETKGLQVDYVGLWEFLTNRVFLPGPNRINGACVLVNSRGSIEQCFSEYMDGPSADVEPNWSRRSWREDGRTRQAFEMLFRAVFLMLRPKGRFVVHANGASNVDWYDRIVTRSGREAGLVECFRKPPTIHAWEKAPSCDS